MIGANLIVLALLGQQADPSRDAAALMEKLGSASYAEREATKSLENLGAKALPALRSALKSKDAEVRTRARALINKIEGNLLIQETPVRLDFQDATLDEIVQSLSKQAGFEVKVGQTAPDSGARRITLRESQPVPFWKAIDRLCEAGQLTAHSQFMGPRGPGAPQPSLVLSYYPAAVTQPSDNHGSFRFHVISLSYQSNILFQSGLRWLASFAPAPEGSLPWPGKKGLSHA